MTSAHDVLAHLRAHALSEYDKGATFERLIPAYLRTDPKSADQLPDIWLTGERPGNGGKHDAEFHAWLRDADYEGARTRRGGSEWFVTSTRFLDRGARTLGLEVRVANDLEAGED